MHQQLYFAFLILIIFSYLIGKNTKIIVGIILKAITKSFMACFNSTRKFCTIRGEVIQIKLKQTLKMQKEKIEKEVQKRVDIEIKTKE